MSVVVSCPLSVIKGAIVRQSKAFPGTGTFLQTGSGELKTLVLQGNVTSNAKKAAEELSKDYCQATEPPTEAN